MALQFRTFCKIYFEPLVHTLSACICFLDILYNSIQNALSILWSTIAQIKDKDLADQIFDEKVQKVSESDTNTEADFERSERPFSCDFCDKKFKQKDKKRVHERSHTGEKPYACTFCGRTFTRRDFKTNHERIHTNERPYSCRFCGFKFKQSQHRLNHERGHRG